MIVQYLQKLEVTGLLSFNFDGCSITVTCTQKKTSYRGTLLLLYLKPGFFHKAGYLQKVEWYLNRLICRNKVIAMWLVT